MNMSQSLRNLAFLASWVTVAFVPSIAGADEAKKPEGPPPQPLVDRWEVIRFGGEGPVEIGKQLIKLGMGDPLTGIRWTGKVPTEHYEIELEGRRTEGFDFFCGLTFPIGKGHASLILGGWGGGVVGLSSINEQDASSNETTQFMQFEDNQWYKIRVRVTGEQVTAWVDDKVIVDVPREDRAFSVRYEMDPTLPLGIAVYQCSSEFRNLKLRAIQADATETPADATEGAADSASDAAKGAR